VDPGLADAVSAAWRAVLLQVGVTLATVAGAAVCVQLVLSMAPGDAVDLAGVGPEQRDALLAHWGLDAPPLERAMRSVGAMLMGELGPSLVVRPGEPVVGLAVGAWLRSLPLLLGGVLIGLGGGLLAAMGRRARALGPPLRLLSAPPTFLAALCAVHGLNAIVFEAWRAGAPRPGWFPLPDTPSLARTLLAVALVAWSAGALGGAQGRLAAAVQRIRDSDWLSAIAVQGGDTTRPLVRAILPELFALGGTQVLLSAGALVVTEKLLGLGGAGRLLWEACLARDLPLVSSLVVGFAVVVGGTRLAFELAHRASDPRLQAPR
jgi:peptide/nickel transport system permease protein